MLINPYKALGSLMAKSAAPTIPNIPQYTPQATPQPTMSDAHIENMLQNIQSYPEEEQQKILDNINKEYGNSEYRGGLVGKAFGNIGNWLGSAVNTAQQGANWATGGLFGWKPFDTQDSDRYRAKTVLRTAAKNPEMMQRITNSLSPSSGQQQQTPPATQPPAAAASPGLGNAQGAAPPAPATTPTPTTPNKPATPTTTPNKPAAPGAPAPAAAAPGAPAPPGAAGAPAAPPATNPEPWKDKTSKFNKKWTPEQKQIYMKNKYGETSDAEKNQSKELVSDPRYGNRGSIGNPAGLQTQQNVDRWGRQLAPPPTEMQQRLAQRDKDLAAQAQQQQWNYVNSGAINAIKQQDAFQKRRDELLRQDRQQLAQKMESRFGSNWEKADPALAKQIKKNKPLTLQ